MLTFMKTDAVGANDYRSIRKAFRDKQGDAIAFSTNPQFSVRLMDVLDIPSQGDDYAEFAARLVKRSSATEVEQVKDIGTAKLLGGRNCLVRVSGHPVVMSGTLHLEVQLTEDLAAAAAFNDDPETATANILVRNTAGNLIKLTYDSADVTVEVTQRFEHWDTIVANTYGRVILINDEWRPDDFDCDAAAGGLI